MENKLDIIANRQHPTIRDKNESFRLINVSYTGGQAYLDSSNLYQYVRENSKSYALRRRRAVYYNQVQPIADMMSGFIFADEVIREVPKNLDYMIERASKLKSMNSFMQKVSIQSNLYTCGVLVDSPKFEEGLFKNLAERRAAGVNPYCVFYYPWQIRDYDYDEDYKLNWILLDNSKSTAKSPLSAREEEKIFTLWTRETVSNFAIKIEAGKTDVTLLGEAAHTLGEIPFIFCNWRDIDDDFICETPFEDVSLLSRSIFNIYSWVDEQLAQGTFKTLFVPIEKTDDVPPDIKKSGFGHLSVFPFRGGLGQSPFFGGVDINNIQFYLDVIEKHSANILSKFGLNPDSDKDYVQSGRAKSVEFQKCEALLMSGSESMEQIEKAIFRFAGLWEGMKDVETKIIYTKEFMTDDINAETERLLSLLQLPYEKLKKEVSKLLIRKNLYMSNFDQKVLKEIFDEIDTQKAPEKIIPDVNSMVKNELQARNTGKDNTLPDNITGKPDNKGQEQ